MNEKSIAVMPYNTMSSGMAFLMPGFVMWTQSGVGCLAWLTVSQCGQVICFEGN